MSVNIQRAIVASEDSRFYQHNGVDAKGIARAFVANHQGGEVQQGASTLTMQYVRMALRDGAKTPVEVQQATEQTSARKIREMRLALGKAPKEKPRPDKRGPVITRRTPGEAVPSFGNPESSIT